MKAWLALRLAHCKPSTSAWGSPSPPDFCGKVKVEGNILNNTNKNEISIKNPGTRKLKMQ
jgi:hypothetical protein